MSEQAFTKEIILILENIRSTHNVGSLFRTADAAGVSRVYLVGVTPDPLDRFGRPQSDIAKTALGAEKTISWEHVTDTRTLIQKLKNEGFIIVSLEQSERSISEIPKIEKIALILGAEVEGVNQETLDASDYILELPMKGQKESLNVSVAGGIALYQLTFNK